MLQDRGSLAVDHIHERHGVRPEPNAYSMTHSSTFPVGAAADAELPVAIPVAPVDIGVFGVGDRLPVQAEREGPMAGRAQGPGVAGSGMERRLAGVAFPADPRADVGVRRNRPVRRELAVQGEQSHAPGLPGRGPRWRRREHQPEGGPDDRREDQSDEQPGSSQGTRHDPRWSRSGDRIAGRRVSHG